MKIVLAIVAVLLPGMASASIRSDLRDYAIAACFIRQTASHNLQTEGHRLADIVINRAGIDPFSWKSLQQAVDRTFAKQPMLMVHVDAPVAQSTQPAPAASCLRVLDAPAVQHAMAALAAKRR